MTISHKQVDEDYTEYQYQSEKADLLSALIDGLYADDEMVPILRLSYGDTCRRANVLRDRIKYYESIERDHVDNFNRWQP